MLDLSEARARRNSQTSADLTQAEDELLAFYEGRIEVPAHRDEKQLVADLEARVTALQRESGAAPPTIEELVEQMYTEQKRQLQAEAGVQARLIADEDINTDRLELELHAIAKAAEELRALDTSKDDGGHNQ